VSAIILIVVHVIKNGQWRIQKSTTKGLNLTGYKFNTIYQISLTAYHYPLATFRFSLFTFHLPLTTFHIPLSTFSIKVHKISSLYPVNKKNTIFVL
jgi:hypothetical protein